MTAGRRDPPLSDLARALRDGTLSAGGLLADALRGHREHDPPLHAYKLLDPEGAATAAAAADAMLVAARRGADPSMRNRAASAAPGRRPGPMAGIPVSVKDLYGMDGLPTFAGTPRRLPGRWSRDGWLVGRLRAQGAVFVGKTHTVEMAYAGVGLNPHWGTPRNPWDDAVHRIPGGSSSGAGPSLHEGSARVALGTDTGGSIRIPASMTGVVGHKTTKGRWPTDGVVPLSATLDTVGALTRTVEDAVWFFGSVDPAWGDPRAFLAHLEGRPPAPAAGGDAAADPHGAASHGAAARPARIGVPRGLLWDACQDDIARELTAALDALNGWTRVATDGSLLDEAADLYLTGAIAGAECRAFLTEELPGWLDALHPIVRDRLAPAPGLTSAAYLDAQASRVAMAARAPALFDGVDVLALPGHLMTPPPLAELEDPDRYRAVNVACLRPTCPVSLLGLCALTLPVGVDDAGMPVGLQLVAPAGADDLLLGVALGAERTLARALARS